MAHVVGEVAYLPTFPFRDLDNALVGGLASGDFDAVVVANGADAAVAVTVTEAATAGYYTPSLTPDETGDWSVVLACEHAGETYEVPFAFEVITAVQADPAAAMATDIAAVQSDVTTVKAMTDVATSTRASAAVWTSGRAERLDRIGADSVAVRSATAASALIELRQGADYTVSADTALEWDVTTTTDLSPVGTVVTLTISSRSLPGDDAITAICAVTHPAAATKTLMAELTDTQTARLRTSEFTRYQIDAQIGTDTVPLVEGRVKVLPALA